jgi:hypothetical protein
MIMDQQVIFNFQLGISFAPVPLLTPCEMIIVTPTT